MSLNTQSVQSPHRLHMSHRKHQTMLLGDVNDNSTTSSPITLSFVGSLSGVLHIQQWIWSYALYTVNTRLGKHLIFMTKPNLGIVTIQVSSCWLLFEEGQLQKVRKDTGDQSGPLLDENDDFKFRHLNLISYFSQGSLDNAVTCGCYLIVISNLDFQIILHRSLDNVLTKWLSLESAMTKGAGGLLLDDDDLVIWTFKFS